MSVYTGREHQDRTFWIALIFSALAHICLLIILPGLGTGTGFDMSFFDQGGLVEISLDSATPSIVSPVTDTTSRSTTPAAVQSIATDQSSTQTKPQRAEVEPKSETQRPSVEELPPSPQVEREQVKPAGTRTPVVGTRPVAEAPKAAVTTSATTKTAAAAASQSASQQPKPTGVSTPAGQTGVVIPEPEYAVTPTSDQQFARPVVTDRPVEVHRQPSELEPLLRSEEVMTSEAGVESVAVAETIAPAHAATEAQVQTRATTGSSADVTQQTDTTQHVKETATAGDIDGSPELTSARQEAPPPPPPPPPQGSTMFRLAGAGLPYPKDAQYGKISFAVVLDVTVAKTGSPISATVVSAQFDSGVGPADQARFTKSAEQMVTRGGLTFEPYTEDYVIRIKVAFERGVDVSVSSGSSIRPLSAGE